MTLTVRLRGDDVVGVGDGDPLPPDPIGGGLTVIAWAGSAGILDDLYYATGLAPADPTYHANQLNGKASVRFTNGSVLVSDTHFLWNTSTGFGSTGGLTDYGKFSSQAVVTVNGLGTFISSDWFDWGEIWEGEAGPIALGVKERDGGGGLPALVLTCWDGVGNVKYVEAAVPFGVPVLVQCYHDDVAIGIRVGNCPWVTTPCGPMLRGPSHEPGIYDMGNNAFGAGRLEADVFEVKLFNTVLTEAEWLTELADTVTYYALFLYVASLGMDGTRLWVEADTLPLNEGDMVTVWPESGPVDGAKDDLRQPSGVDPPRSHNAVLNGYPVVRCEKGTQVAHPAAGQYLSTAAVSGRAFHDTALYPANEQNLSDGNGFSLFLLGRLNSFAGLGTDFYFLSDPAASFRFGVVIFEGYGAPYAGNVTIFANDAAEGYHELYLPYTLGEPLLVEVWYDGTILSACINGGTVVTEPVTGLSVNIGYLEAGLKFGTEGDQGELALLWGNRANLDECTRDLLRCVISTKYGLGIVGCDDGGGGEEAETMASVASYVFFW